MSDASGLLARFERLLPDTIRRRYLRKFLLVVVVVGLVVLGIGIFTQQTVSAELTENRNDQLQAATERTADNVQRWLEQKQGAADSLSKDPAIASGDSDSGMVNIALQRAKLNGGESLVAVHYVNVPKRLIRDSSVDGLENTSLESQNLRWGTTSSGDGLLGIDRDTAGTKEVYTVDNRSLIAFSSPTQSFMHGVVMAYDLDARSQQFQNVIEGGTTEVVSTSGSVMIPSNESQVFDQYPGGANATALQRGANTSGILNRGDELVAYAPVNGTDWVVVKSVPTANAYALKNTIQTHLIGLIGAALLGLVVLAVYVGRDVIPRIATVGEQASAIAEGDLDIAVQDEGRIDEIGQVRDAFRETTNYLRTVASQADALARQDFDDPALDERVPGELGASLETMQEDLQASIEEIESAREQAQASKQEAQAMAESLQQQADEFSTVMAEAADGDLTQRLDEDVDDDAMRAIAVAANEMLMELEQTLQEVRAFAEDVDASAEDVAASASEVRRVSEDVSESVQDIAEGADRQDETVQDATDELTDLSAAIEEVASSAEGVAQKSRQAADLGETASELGSDALGEMDAVESQAETTITEVERLESAMEEIGEIAGLIDDIADQTNMLALNASIEAARAGEAGEGFAVVADEIKGLAQETAEATQDIEQRIQEVQETTDHVVGDMHEMGESVTDGIDAVEDAVQLLEQLVEQVEDADTGVQSINDATDDQADSTEQVVAMMDDVGSISEQTAQEAESVSAAAEEQTASITEVSEQIQALADRSSGLRDAVEQFTLEASGPESGPETSETQDTAADGGSQE
ncbi:methyl-accepting chemotaxis protein [Halorhabdus sp. CUG00001]|uniref:methyl-accepting chemotaxis protein n=1 Tax=Halorhabdus sp. CUG00001 TaxID=2600297 RepID=UPI00131C2FD0|nr:methyl-accepting chemotaxis protein [Halorhabdus sp. CUG00001]